MCCVPIISNVSRLENSMSGEILLLVTLLAYGAYWYFNRTKAKKPPSAAPTPSPALSPIPEAVRSGVQTVTDPFLNAVAAKKARSDAVVAAATQEYKHELDGRFSEDLALKERLSKFARANELDKALIALWEEIRHYPAWSSREDFAKWNKLQLTGVSGETNNDFRSVEFTHGSQTFKLSERSWSGMEAESYADFSLLENSDEVFAISCSSEYGNYGTDYNCLSISAFKKHGAWANVLLELHALIQIERNKTSAGFGYFRAEEIKSRFKE